MNNADSDLVWEQIFRRREWGKYPPEHVVRFVMTGFRSVPERKRFTCWR